MPNTSRRAARGPRQVGRHPEAEASIDEDAPIGEDTSRRPLERVDSYQHYFRASGTKTLADIGLFSASLPWPPSSMHEVDHHGRDRVAMCRIGWFFVLLLCFFFVQTNMMVDQELTSGVRGSFVAEFFPDAGKVSERLKDGEVTPAVAEIMQAGDVSQTLNWYATFCRTKGATDSHIMDAWKCRLTQVVVGKPSKPVWDPFENRGLPSDKAEDPTAMDTKSKYSQDFDIDPERKQANNRTIKEGLSAIDEICNERFLSWHLGRGDDPLGKLGRVHVPFGNAHAFSRQVLKGLGIEGIENKDLSADYDEFTVLDHNSMFSSLSDQMDKQLGLTKKLDGIESKLDEHIKSLADKAAANSSSILQLSPTKGRSVRIGQPFSAAPLPRIHRRTSPESLHDQRPGARKKRSGSHESMMQLVAEASSWPPEPALPDESSKKRSEKTNAFRGPKHAHGSESTATFFPGGFLQRSAAHMHTNSSDNLSAVVPDSSRGTSSSQDEIDEDEAVRDQEEERLSKQEAESGVDYGRGCFETTDIVGMLLDEFIDVDKDSSGQLDKKEILVLLSDVYELDIKQDKAKMSEMVRQIDKNGNNYVTVDEYLDFVRTHASELRLRERGFLSEACRNHHWGLVGLCKPQDITAEFRVQRIHRQVNGFVRLGSYLDLKIEFTEVGTKRGSGYYRANIDIDSEDPPGGRSVLTLVAAGATTILILLLLILDALYTVLRWPFNFIALWRFGDDPDLIEDIQDEETRQRKWHEFITLVKSFFDGRQVKLQFLSLEYLAMELFTAFVFGAVVIISTIDAFSPQIVPMGRTLRDSADRRKCADAFLNADIKWSEQLLKGTLTGKRGLSPVSYMRNCMEWNSGVEYCFELLLEIVYAHQLHAYVAALLCLRCLQMFEYWERMKWLPLTIKLASGKLCNFLIMYFFVVASYASLFYMTFGRLYPQFDSFHASCWALMLYSFGFTFRAEDGIYPFIETSGTLIILFLWFFMITVVTIGLNFFTTIILDAFAKVSDTSFDENDLIVDQVKSFSWLSSLVNVPEELFKGPDLKAEPKERVSFMKRFSRRVSLKPDESESLESIEEEDESQDKLSSSPAEDSGDEMRKKMAGRKAVVEKSS